MFDLSPLIFTPPQRPEPSEDRSEVVNTPTAGVVETVDWVAAMKTTNEGGDELSDLLRRITPVHQGEGKFESGVVVDQHQQVLMVARGGPEEGSRDVGVN